MRRRLKKILKTARNAFRELMGHYISVKFIAPFVRHSFLMQVVMYVMYSEILVNRHHLCLVLAFYSFNSRRNENVLGSYR